MTRRLADLSPAQREAQRQQRRDEHARAKDKRLGVAPVTATVAPPEEPAVKDKTTWGKETRAQKQQEYNENMGRAADMLGDIARDGGVDGAAAERVGAYVASLAQEERQYLNRRVARSVSIGLARDALFLRSFEERIARMPVRIEPSGCAMHAAPRHSERIVNLALSDLHFGAALDSSELPIGTNAVTETRRLARVVAEARDYKPQYRDISKLHVYILGDIIEGLLKHNDRDGDQLTDQFVSMLYALIQAVGALAAAYPSVSIWFSPGNHGRNIVEHPGRSTSSKWDSFETMIALAVKAACRELHNVEWHVDKRPYIAVPLFNGWLFGTHGDTLLNIGNPGKSLNVAAITSQMNAINASGEYLPADDGRFDVFVAGHVHTGVLLHLPPGNLIINPPLCPPNGFARGFGAHRERCGQWLWESVEGYPVGDARLIEVSGRDDDDASLDSVIRHCAFAGDAWGLR